MTDETTPKKSNKKWLIVAIVGAVGCLPAIGCIAAIGVPAFINYIKKSKSSEARSNISALVTGVRSNCEAGNPYLAAGPLPLVPGAETQSVSFSSDPGFTQVAFNPGASVRYSYSVVPDGNGNAMIRAEGDLNADGETSMFESRCDKTCACSPVTATKELE